MPSDVRSQKDRSAARGPAKPRDRRRGTDVATYVASTLLVLATVAAYSNSLRCPFVFDDVHDIVDNPSIRSLWPLGRVFVGESATAESLLARIRLYRAKTPFRDGRSPLDAPGGDRRAETPGK